SAARTRMPIAKEPLEDCNDARIAGPACPPRFPIELIIAIPPAAAVPVRKAVGNPQNGPMMLQRPETQSVKAKTTSRGGIGKDRSTSPSENHQAAVATCQRRSFMRSERRPCRIMMGIVMRGGIAESQPSWDFASVGNALCNSVGRKKSPPYPAHDGKKIDDAQKHH